MKSHALSHTVGWLRAHCQRPKSEKNPAFSSTKIAIIPRLKHLNIASNGRRNKTHFYLKSHWSIPENASIAVDDEEDSDALQRKHTTLRNPVCHREWTPNPQHEHLKHFPEIWKRKMSFYHFEFSTRSLRQSGLDSFFYSNLKMPEVPMSYASEHINPELWKFRKPKTMTIASTKTMRITHDILKKKETNAIARSRTKKTPKI